MPRNAAVVRVVLLAATLAAMAWAGFAGGAIAQTTVAGATPGNLSVGADGQASYSIPIAVPPGIAGVHPSLSLSYSSGGGNGIAGVGWRVSGLSAIERCRRTLAQDDAWGGIEYGPNDKLCLGGNRLVAINGGAYGAPGTEYRTEIDGFTRIVSYGRVASLSGVPGFSPEEFRVWTKSGWILDFGATPDSQVEAVRAVAAGDDIPVEIKSWALSRVTDAAGNSMTVSYIEDTATGAHRPDRIDYTYNDSAPAPVAAQSSVRFVYEPRPDVRRNYPNGSLTTLDVRLQSIRTYTDGAPVRDYRLAYETGAATGRSRLVSVTECDRIDTAANCLAPHRFAWQQEDAGFTSAPGYKIPFESPEVVDDFDDGTFVDLNGDGREDFIAAVDDGRGFFNLITGSCEGSSPHDYRKAWLNTGAGWEVSAAYQPVFDVKVFRNDCHPGAQQGEFVDVDGDGLKDFVLAVRHSTRFGDQVVHTHSRTTWLNTGSGWVESTAYQAPFDIFMNYERTFEDCPDYPREPCNVAATHYYDARTGEFVDLNGDGFLDFVQAVQIEEYGDKGRPDFRWQKATYLNAWINTGDGWASSPEYQPPTILRKYYSERLKECVGSEQECTTIYSKISGGTATFADVDGDNLPDYVQSYRQFFFSQPTDYRTTWLNTGGGWAPSSAYTAPVEFWVHGGGASHRGGRLADVNGDGLADVVQAGDRDGQTLQATWVNTGDGWAEDADYRPTFVFYSGSHSPRLRYWGSKMRRVTDGAELFDVNGDGLPDVVWASQSGGTVDETWLNTGSGWELDQTYQPPFDPGQGSYHVTAVIDISGDGVDDLVRFGVTATPNSEPYNRESWLTNSVRPDLLLTVTDSLGKTSALSYAPLTDPEIYEKYADAAYPVRDVQTPRHVVAEVARDDGVGGLYRTEYRYAGAKIHLRGRSVGAGMANLPNANDGSSDLDNSHVGGAAAQYTFDWGSPPSGTPGSLGFRAVFATDLQTGIVTARRHAQTFPHIGWADIAASYIPDPTGQTDGTLIERTTHSFDWEGLHWAGDPPHPRTVFPYVSQSVAERAEPNDGPGNAAIVTAVTTREYGDGFGNPTLVTTVTQGGGETFTASRSNQYKNDAVNWFIGRLERTEETRTLPDLSSATRVRSYVWNDLTGMLEQAVIEPDIPALTLTTDYLRDDFGHVETTTVSGPDILTRSETVLYPTEAPNFGRFATTATNALDHKETREYDHRYGTVTKLTDPNDVVTEWQYDGFGRRKTEIRPDGGETRWSWNFCPIMAPCPLGSVYTVSQQNFETATGLAYDARRLDYRDRLDRVVRGETRGFDGEYILAETLFNALGQVWAVSRPYFEGTATGDIHWTVTTYDDIGRVKTETAPDGGEKSFDYAGLTTTATNALNQTEEHKQNAIGQLRQVTDNLNTVKAFAYDPFGNLMETNVGGVVTTMQYDIRGRKYAMADPDMGAWSYAHNALDELTGQTDARGQTAEMTYDLLGRIATRSEAEGLTTWTYDSTLKIAGIGKPDKVTRTEDDYVEDQFYDETTGKPSETVITYEGSDYASTITYDSVGRPEVRTYPAASDGSRLAARNHYNEYGYLDTVQDAGPAATIWWEGRDANADLEMILATLGNGLTAERDFDPATGRISDIWLKDGLTPLQDQHYKFDHLGNLEYRIDRFGNRREDFGYDGLNQLTRATVTDSVTLAVLGEIETQISALGNIEYRPDVGFYVYDGIAAGPHAVSQAGNVAYTYDANGNMTGSAFADTQVAIRSVTWSSFNKPTRVADALGLAASEFVYGPSRARVKQTVFDGAAVSRTVTYIGESFERRAFPSGPDHLVHYIRAGGNVVAEFTKLDDANPATDKTRYLHRDHLGSVALVTDEAGLVAEARSFGPWGEARNADWSVPASPPPLLETPRGFTGHEHLPTVGLIHMNGRVYDPKIGRFMSPDPSDALNPGVGFNRYAYVKNNPVSLVDPSGFEFGTNAERGYGDDGRGYSSRDGGFESARQIVGDLVRQAIGKGFSNAVRMDILNVDLSPLLDFAHVALDFLGMAPAVGFVPDGVNAGIYALEGDKFNAGLSGAAMAPIAGQAVTAAKYGGKLVDAGQALRGAQNPVVAEAAAKGRQIHNDWDYGPGFVKERALPSGKRPDAVNWEKRQVVELKPNNPRAMQRGWRQVERYRLELEEITGKSWCACVVGY